MIASVIAVMAVLALGRQLGANPVDVVALATVSPAALTILANWKMQRTWLTHDAYRHDTRLNHEREASSRDRAAEAFANSFDALSRITDPSMVPHQIALAGDGGAFAPVEITSAVKSLMVISAVGWSDEIRRPLWNSLWR